MNKTLIMCQPFFDKSQFIEFAKRMIKSKDKVFIINYANEPVMLKKRFNRIGNKAINEKYYQELREKLSLFGVQPQNIIYSDDEDKRTDFLYKYEHCDVLILCGGAPESLLDKFEELNICEIIKTTKKPIICYSAGAEVLLDFLTLYPSAFWENAGDYYKHFSTRKAIGRVANLSITFHYERKKSEWVTEACDFIKKDIYAITDEQGLFINGDHYEWIGSPQKFEYKQGE